MALYIPDERGPRAGAMAEAETLPWPGLIDRLFDIERGRFALWVPVLFASGIGVYFSLPSEPPMILAGAMVIIVVASRLVARDTAWGVLLSGLLCCMALGFFAAKLRTELVAAPALGKPMDYASITGWAEMWEDRTGQKNRLTIRVHAIDELAPELTPQKVRITTHADMPPQIGALIEVRAGLLPPPGPARPGGFDFARMAYFMGLGAVGYAKSDITVKPGPAPPLTLQFWARVEGVRAAISDRVGAVLAGPAAGIATALISGDRGGIAEAEKEAMRGAGLAHVLAISGLHMAIMAGSIYWAVRMLLVVLPGLALRYPVKKWAAIAALIGGMAYLLISGASVATQRAFIMTAVFMVAVLLDRPALTLRNVLVAAILILSMRPESLLNVSFQMSFAAATALIAVYEQLQGRSFLGAGEAGKRGAAAAAIRFGRGIVRYAGGIAMTTMIAGIAVAPIGAFHFHTATSYSLVGNVLAMPVVGLWVMPAALASLVTLPFGLANAPLLVMDAGIDVMLSIAREVSAFPGAVRPIDAFPLSALILIAVGALWLAIWRGRWRYCGVAIVGAGMAMTSLGTKPDILIDRDGKVLAVRKQNGRLAAMPGRAGNYSLEKWLAASGDRREPKSVRDPRVFHCDRRGCVAHVRGIRLSVARHPAALAQDCKLADIVVTSLKMTSPCRAPRVVVTHAQLRAEGAHAIYIDDTRQPARLNVVTTAQTRGKRPWTQAR